MYNLCLILCYVRYLKIKVKVIVLYLFLKKFFGELISLYFKYFYEDLIKDSIFNLFINVIYVNLYFF